jgi:hypothetical protein
MASGAEGRILNVGTVHTRLITLGHGGSPCRRWKQQRRRIAIRLRKPVIIIPSIANFPHPTRAEGQTHRRRRLGSAPPPPPRSATAQPAAVEHDRRERRGPSWKTRPLNPAIRKRCPRAVPSMPSPGVSTCLTTTVPSFFCTTTGLVHRWVHLRGVAHSDALDRLSSHPPGTMILATLISPWR